MHKLQMCSRVEEEKEEVNTEEEEGYMVEEKEGVHMKEVVHMVEEEKGACMGEEEKEHVHMKEEVHMEEKAEGVEGSIRMKLVVLGQLLGKQGHKILI